MSCVCCGSEAVTERPEVIARGYRRFRCRDCGRQFDERGGGALNRTSVRSVIVAFAVLCRLRYRLTVRDLSEVLLLHGTGDQLLEHDAVETAHGTVVDILHGYLMAQLGIAQTCGEPSVVALADLMIEEQRQPFRVAEAGAVGIGQDLAEYASHAELLQLILGWMSRHDGPLGVPMGPVIVSIHEKRAEFQAGIKAMAPDADIRTLGGRRLASPRPLREGLGEG